MITSTLTIVRGEKFVIQYADGSSHTFTYEQWLELRRMQNAFIHTEPV